jgi:hypothetical protein
MLTETGLTVSTKPKPDDFITRQRPEKAAAQIDIGLTYNEIYT